jgi:hypothetical protein
VSLLEPEVRLRSFLELELLLDHDLEVRFGDGAAQSLELVGTYFGVVGTDLDLRPLLRLGLDAVRVDDATAGDDVVDAFLQIFAARESEDRGESIRREQSELLGGIAGTRVQHIFDAEVA